MVLPLHAAVVLASAAACGRPRTGSNDNGSSSEWRHYAGDVAGTRHSSDTSLTRENVAKLEVAWTSRVGDFPARVFDPLGHRAGNRREDGTAVAARPGASCGACHINQPRFEATPLVTSGSMYVSTPRNRVLALDPSNGQIRWSYDPKVDTKVRYVEGMTSRGLSYWTDSAADSSLACAKRLFMVTIDARLVALDATDGTLCSGFGDDGTVRLDPSVTVSGKELERGEYTATSPPTIVRDVVVVGSAMAKNHRQDSAAGFVRGYDARTGMVRWTFHLIPGIHYSGTTETASRATAGANVWSIISADSVRDLVFLPTASAAPDSYGGQRLGRNDFANSVVALRATTGELVWSFQTVHHDLWDYDVAAQPLLVTWHIGDRELPAVIVGTKTGMFFVLHRESGLPIVPVEERAVPVSDVPGEEAWPSQPFPARGPALQGATLSVDSAFGLTVDERTFCRAWMSRLRNEGLFTPPSLQGTLLWPGFWGGINWDGMAWDPNRRILVTTFKRMAMVVQLRRRYDRSREYEQPTGQERMAQHGTPYVALRAPFVAPSGTPCSPPPWGALIAVDLSEGKVLWQRPLGIVPWLKDVPNADRWGSLIFGGPLLTATGLIFVAASQDDRIRAFDTATGDLLWEHDLPAGGQAAPMTYTHRGKQYLVIAAGGRSGIGSPGDWIVAFALPEKRRPDR